MTKRFVALGIVVAIVAILWTGAWFAAATMATSTVKSLETADGVNNPRLTCGRFGIGGFPFGFDATCTDAAITSGDDTVTLAGLKASVLVFNPFHVLAFAQGPATYDDAYNGIRRRLDFADAEASARLTGWRIGRVSVVINEPVLTDTIVEDRPMGKAARAELHLIDVPDKYDATAGLATLAEHVAITGLDAPGIEIAGGNAVLDAEITNLPDDVRTYGDADLLRRWQAGGGKLLIVSFKGQDDDTNFDTSGTLGLDSTGRVEGQIKINSTGVVELVQDQIPQEVRGLLLGAQAADGSYSQVLNIAAGVVLAGVLPAAVIPPVW
ncbi:MAG: DUF2125 domain-containing protein [Devosia sp.]